ncbi:thiamine diphosphokinase [Candidatus Ozemobacteraceae bacterium]|nr:thiamine diphosphokinase [Candidatus Ozemobacteraceae bacterium]
MSIPSSFFHRHLVVLGGPAGPDAPVPGGAGIPAGPWSDIMAVDGGANTLCSWNVAAQTVVGDGDSITPEASVFHETAGAVFHRFQADKDATDFELALNVLNSAPEDEIHLVGMTGGRTDMSLANLLVLGSRTGKGFFTFDLPDGCGGVMGPGSLEIDLPAETPSALLALSPSASGIVSQGVRWPLNGETISLHEARGVSNIVTAPPWHLRLASGALLWLLRGLRRSDIRLAWAAPGQPSQHGSPS